MRAGANEIPLPVGLGVAVGIGSCALAHTTKTKNQQRTAANRKMFLAGDIDLETFQQGMFGPGEILNMSVAEETPAAKNCGLTVKTASKT